MIQNSIDLIWFKHDLSLDLHIICITTILSDISCMILVLVNLTAFGGHWQVTTQTTNLWVCRAHRPDCHGSERAWPPTDGQTKGPQITRCCHNWIIGDQYFLRFNNIQQQDPTVKLDNFGCQQISASPPETRASCSLGWQRFTGPTAAKLAAKTPRGCWSRPCPWQNAKLSGCGRGASQASAYRDDGFYKQNQILRYLDMRDI